jgi:hypothetical protein
VYIVSGVFVNIAVDFSLGLVKIAKC